ncbi:MAG: 23S rRNA (adenine(2030)-N(6))-methyltransferase RlmJ [Gammaproteobacteria bacterium]|nr:23S rRNA (adenine(2030)-N(6))-methyltransferase RlmJ [Gammaproteobacteria bacterium]
MNYQHGFHAGSAADVLKHVVLTFCLERLMEKARPLFVLDTHAGDGLYRIASAPEAQEGILRLWPERHNWPELAAYFAAIARHNGTALKVYPGSPLLISSLLRKGDRLIAVEQAPRAHAALQQVLRSPQTQIFLGSAWQGLSALLPPAERRALILIDPPYEAARERRELVDGLKQALVKFRQGVYLVWYPVKERREADRLRKGLEEQGPSLSVELLTFPADVHNRLNGSGMVIINPPFGVENRLGEVLPRLAKALSQDGVSRYVIQSRAESARTRAARAE